jgi:hypothetical protein
MSISPEVKTLKKLLDELVDYLAVQNSPYLYCIVGTSGSGKTTQTEYIRDAIRKIFEARGIKADGLRCVESMTTRKPRFEGETGHVFLSKEEFDSYTEEQMRLGHGGIDFWMLRNFIRYIKGEFEPFFNVYRATALSAAAILAWRSVLDGGKEHDVPDFSKEEDKARYENDFLSPSATEESGNLIPLKAR